MVTIRLTRRGAKNHPFYHIVVTDSRERQGGKALEHIGYFNPIPAGKQQRLQVDLARVDYWVSKGARTSDRVAELVSKQRRQVAATAAATPV
jgi:small subunit ribosomal protein S16